jgi:hypothetical protein
MWLDAEFMRPVKGHGFSRAANRLSLHEGLQPLHTAWTGTWQAEAKARIFQFFCSGPAKAVPLLQDQSWKAIKAI